MVLVHQLDPYCVGEIRELQGKPNREQARQMLEQVARQVQPILRRRKLTVPLLLEFCPRNANLLGLNVGGGGGGTREIRVRLRPARADADFLPYESVLGTMLHEVAHNMVGPHNAAFYKLLDELTQECEELTARGISGTGMGFDAPAAGKAGGRFEGRGLSAQRLRELALRAAEGRLQKQALMPVGPRTAGGDLSLRSLPPREAAARAAERRLRDNLWCPAEALGAEGAEGHGVDAALQAILDNGGRGQQQQQQQQHLNPEPAGVTRHQGVPLRTAQQLLPQDSQRRQQQRGAGAKRARNDGSEGGLTALRATLPRSAPTAADDDIVDLTGTGSDDEPWPRQPSSPTLCLHPDFQRHLTANDDIVDLTGGASNNDPQQQQQQPSNPT